VFVPAPVPAPRRRPLARRLVESARAARDGVCPRRRASFELGEGGVGGAASASRSTPKTASDARRVRAATRRARRVASDARCCDDQRREAAARAATEASSNNPLCTMCGIDKMARCSSTCMAAADQGGVLVRRRTGRSESDALDARTRSAAEWEEEEEATLASSPLTRSTSSRMMSRRCVDKEWRTRRA